MSLFFWSDSHFNHSAVIGYSGRPDAGVEAMNERLVAAWNSVVTDKDDVYHLGDFALGDAPHKVSDIFGALRGKKHLILGNHDEKNRRTLALPWVSVDRLREVRHDGHRIVLCHYPIESWASKHHGSIHLHGHSHGQSRFVPRRFDVGVDVFAAPVSAELVLELLPAVEPDHRNRTPDV